MNKNKTSSFPFRQKQCLNRSIDQSTMTEEEGIENHTQNAAAFSGTGFRPLPCSRTRYRHV